MTTPNPNYPEVIVNEVSPGVGVLLPTGETPEPTCPTDPDLHARVQTRAYEIRKGMGFPGSPISPEFPQFQNLHALLSGMRQARRS